MASSDVELQDEVRNHLGFNEHTLSESELRTNLSRAKSWIASRKASLALPQDVVWYGENQAREEALFWTTCLFSKMTTGEVDSPSTSVGNINVGTLGADETELYRKSKEALSNIGDNTSGFGITTLDGDIRGYEEDN
jgi:hypothetical protein